MAKPPSRRREIERLFALREREGLSLRALADRSGIPVGTLSWWSHRLRQEESPAFTEVRVVDDQGDVSASPAPLRDAGGACRMRLSLPSGVVAELEGDLADRVASALVEDLLRWS